MKPGVALLLIAALGPAVSGCAARQRFLDRIHADRGVPIAEPAVHPAVADKAVPAAAEPAVNAAPAVPPGMQFLYGSGEAAALDYQAYAALANFVVSAAAERAVGHDVRSVVLAPGATLDKPTYEPCGDKPLAVVLDVDETSVLNLGFEADAATGRPYDPARWSEWERTGGADVVAVPGALDMAKAATAAGVTLVFNSNRSAANADATAAMLTGVGFPPVGHGKTLWLQGDAGGSGGGKDARRWAISSRYCVVAMAGDQLGDFSDLFNAPGQSLAARRAAVGGRHVGVLWGHGWFILPNPVYGTALKGSPDEVFPLDKRWTPSAAPASATAAKEN